MCALILLTAFEALAVTTVMPTISRELHGAALYALAFAGPLAVGVVGMVVAGNWSDRSGPRGALIASVVLFVIGLAIVGTAVDMGVLVVGRLVQGLGAGALTVALYVVVARIYPAELHTRIFAAFAAAWVVPSLIGPLIAGFVAQTVGWRWVFLGVIALVVIAMIMVIPALRALSAHPQAEGSAPWRFGRIAWSVAVAVAVLAVTLAGEAHGPVLWFVPVVAVVIALFSIRPLLPTRTLTSAIGLPSVVLIRGLISGCFFAADVYVPYLLTQQYHFAASGAGLSLTVSGLAWAGGSWLQSRLGDRLSHVQSMRYGSALLVIAVLAVFATAAFVLPAAVAIVGWVFAGAGMGLMYPRTSVATLEYSTIENQGFNSAGLSIADSIGASIALAATAIVFSVLGPLGGGWPFAGCFALAVLLGIAAFILAPRVRAIS
jgi:MFS family permease